MPKLQMRALVAFIVLAVILTGCGNSGKPQQSSNEAIKDPIPAATPSAAPIEQTLPDQSIKEKDTILYFADANMEQWIEQSIKLSYETDEDLIEKTIEALRQDGAGDLVSLWKPIDILRVELKDGLATVDIHITDQARVGAPGELALIESLQMSLFQYDFVTAIEILVDGQKVESLMGHVSLEHPYEK